MVKADESRPAPLKSVVHCADFDRISRGASTWTLSFDIDFVQAQSEFGFTMLGAGAAS